MTAHICSLVHTFASKIACEDMGDGGNGVGRGGGRPIIEPVTDVQCVMSTALPVAEESRSCIKQPALLFDAIQAAFSASVHGRYYAVATAIFAATLVATKFLM